MGKGDNRKSNKEIKKPKKDKLKVAVAAAPRASADVPVVKKKTP